MRELTYFTAVTLDGFVADPSGSDPTDTSPGGFFLSQGDHSEPLLTAYPETLPGAVRELLGLDAENKVFDTVLMGRKTWQLGMDLGTANPYPRLRSYVFSRSRTDSPDPGRGVRSGRSPKEDPGTQAGGRSGHLAVWRWEPGAGALAGDRPPGRQGQSSRHRRRNKAVRRRAVRAAQTGVGGSPGLPGRNRSTHL